MRAGYVCHSKCQAEDRPQSLADVRGISLSSLEPHVRADLMGGKIFMHSPARLAHARLVGFIDCLLQLYIEKMDLGALYREVVAVRLSARETFMPDLAFFTKAQASRLAETHAPFAPAFVVEVLSPATATRDTGPKFAAYESHGVHEYWILDPEKGEHRFYRREGDLLSEFGQGMERIDSWSIRGFWVKQAWLHPDRHPTVAKCLEEILRPTSLEIAAANLNSAIPIFSHEAFSFYLFPVTLALGIVIGAEIPDRPEKLSYPPLTYEPPNPTEFRTPLKAGPVAYIVPDRELPLVTVSVLVRVGSYLDPEEKLGLADFTGFLLARGGTADRTAEEMEERLAFLAANLGSSIGNNSGSVSLNLLSKDLPEGLAIMREVLTSPRFQQNKLDLYRDQNIQAMKQRNDDSSSIEGREREDLSFGSNFYASRQETEASVQSITQEDLKAFHRRWFHPANFVVAASGDFDRSEMIAKLEALFELAVLRGKGDIDSDECCVRGARPISGGQGCQPGSCIDSIAWLNARRSGLPVSSSDERYSGRRRIHIAHHEPSAV